VKTQLSETTEENYYTIIRKKTAQLFASCCEVGALSAGASEDALSHLRNFGMYLGISFQIKDDIFDYFENIKIGKPTGNDIRDGKVTLPLIYALQQASDGERTIIAHWIDARDYSSENIQTITRFAHKMGGVDYAIEQMEVYKHKAIEELNSFVDSDVKKSLILCAEYAASRKF
jgi:octaprenyl-diphosphate synthase